MSHHKKPVTLKTLANLLGLTPATISKALRDSSDISKKTRLLVKEKANELGYQPNIMARTLIKRRSHILGVVVSDLSISFFSEVTRGIYEKARELGFEAILLVHDMKNSLEKRNLEFFSALNVDGILIDAVPGTNNLDLLKRVNDRGIPIVCYDRRIEGLDFPAVTNDDETAAFKIVEYFVSQGRKNIVYLGPEVIKFLAHSRYQGYYNALSHFGIPYRPEYVVSCKLNRDDLEEKIYQFVRSGRKFDALLCTGGLDAYVAGKAVLSAKLSIPNDVMLAEFGNNNIVHRLGVPFISIDQFPYEMGQSAVELIVKVIEHGRASLESDHIFIDTKLLFHHSNHNY